MSETKATTDECRGCGGIYRGFVWHIVEGEQYCDRCMKKGVRLARISRFNIDRRQT